MPYSEPVGEERISGSSYAVSFQSSVDPAVHIEIRMTEGDSGPFFGLDSDALMQEVVDLLSTSSLLQFSAASRSWPERRIITPTPAPE